MNKLLHRHYWTVNHYHRLRDIPDMCKSGTASEFITHLLSPHCNMEVPELLLHEDYLVMVNNNNTLE